MKKVMIGIGAFVGGVITGAAAMLVYKNIQIGKKSKLHEENYNNLNDLFGQQDSPNKTNIFNDTFSSSFSKSDLVDKFGVNFDSGDENYEEDTEDWAPIEVKNHFDNELSLDNGLNFNSELKNYCDNALNFDNDTEDWSSDEADDLWFLTADNDTEDEEDDEEPKGFEEDEEYDESPEGEDEEEDIDWSPEGEDEEFEDYDEEPNIEDEDYDEESKGYDEDEFEDEKHIAF